MNRRAAAALCAASFAVLPVVGAGAQQPAATVEVTAVRADGRDLTSSVAVLDTARNPVIGLGVADFVAQIDGATVPVASVTTGTNQTLPLGLVLAVDTSGSMAGGAIASARQALLPLVTALQPGDQASVLTFAQAVNTAVPLTADRAALTTGLEAMQAAGNTALFAGVTRAAEAAAGLPQPRKAVVLLSDGEDFGNASGGITRDQALGAARSSGAPFFVVGLGLEVDQQFLTSLARENGGQYFAATTPAELAGLYARISDRLRQQYTVRIEIPASAQPGEHRVTFSANGASGQASFTVPSTGTVPAAALAGLPSELRESVVVRVDGLPAGTPVVFEVDGSEVKAEPDGRSVRLDPYLLDPLIRHRLTARAGSGAPVEAGFAVAALAPRLVSPTTLPNLRPGDLVRLTVESQPGSTSVAYLVDGREIERDFGPPFEFILPAGDYAAGKHTLAVVLSNGTASATTTYEFPGAKSGGRNVAAYLLFALLGIAALAGLVFLMRRLLAAAAARREETPVPADIREIESWVQGSTREGITPRTTGAVVEAPAPRQGAWGRLRVVEGADAGKLFTLSEETELVGRGRHASVRLSDKAIEDAHCILSRDGYVTPSTPTAGVFIDGSRVRRAEFRPGTHLRIGSTTLVLEAAGE